MESKKVVLVTGANGYWGKRVAAKLLTDPGYYVIGIDTIPPDDIPEGLDFIQADIRNPLMVELLRAENVDTVCHLAFSESRRKSEKNFDLNVMGTMKVFGACAEAGVRKIVHRSSTTVYGADPQNPAFLTESYPLHGNRTYANVRYMVEIESFCNGFRVQAPDVLLTTLRFANIVGPTAPSPMNTMLKERFAPILLGFSPIMQIIHEDDVVDALVHAVVNDVPGTYNVAAPGYMPLTQILALAGAIPAPLLHPLAYWGQNTLRGGRLNPMRYLPIDLDYLRFRWVADTSKMTDEHGFYPQFDATETLKEFATHKRMGKYESDSISDLDLDEERLRGILKRRQRTRERQAAKE